MIRDVCPKIAREILDNAELNKLIAFLVFEANFAGKQGKSVNNLRFNLTKRNPLKLRFYESATLEWEESC